MKALTRPFLTRFTIGLVSASLALAGMVATAEPTRAQVIVASLMGETLAARSGLLGNVGTITISANCDAPGGPTISYTAMGQATGPYPGPYVESGTATLGPFIGNLRPTVSFVASFTIDSPAGDVTGMKQLAPGGLLVNQGGCSTFEEPGVGTVANHFFSALATYTAEITTATVTCTTGGSSNTNVFEQDAPGEANDARSFLESFTTGTPCLVVASDRDECRDGGWATAVREDGTGFKNQGDCMRYVSTGK